jgi:hypothetical protein
MYELAWFVIETGNAVSAPPKCFVRLEPQRDDLAVGAEFPVFHGRSNGLLMRSTVGRCRVLFELSPAHAVAPVPEALAKS